MAESSKWPFLGLFKKVSGFEKIADKEKEKARKKSQAERETS